MQDDRPLDGLIPGLRPAGRGSRAHLMEAAIGSRPAWVIAIDEPLEGALALQRRVQEILESAILARLSEPAPSVAAHDPAGYGAAPTAGVHLLIYRSIPGDLARAVAPFGLLPSTLSGSRWDEIRAAITEAIGPGSPSSSYSARVEVVPEIEDAHRALVEDTLEPWGSEPGQPALRLLHLAEDLGRPELDADPDGLDGAIDLCVSKTAGVLRWMPPLVMQALADLVGVVAQRLGSRVEWAECAPESDGYTPPPLFRLTTKHADEPVHLPIGLHLVRWCVMPLRPGEVVPPLSAWLADQLGVHGNDGAP